MRKLFITLLFLLYSASLYATDSNLYIYQYDKYIGKFTIEQFTTLVEGADKYEEIMLAQKEQRLHITCDKVLASETAGGYTTIVKIVWKDKEGEELNYITAELTMNIDNDTTSKIPEWRIIYRDISEVGFPICGGLIILVLIILL